MNLIRKSLHGLKGLLSGMGLTFRYFVRFDKVITQQYPENRATLMLPPRSRGRLELVKDGETQLYRCSACGICVKACPNNSIAVGREKDPVTKKMRLTKYEYHFERCTLCGLCVDSCRFEALRMGQQFETAVFTRDELVQILNEDFRPTTPAAPPAASAPPTPSAAPKPPDAPKPPGQPDKEAKT